MVKILSFDGLNRSGKGTQIGLLKRDLAQKSVEIEVLRGDGSRPGLNTEGFYDPLSEWWIDWQMKEKTVNDWNEAYTVLKRENEERLREFSYQSPNGIILMDRSYISRYFMLKQQGKESTLEQIAREQELIPTTYFILHAPRDTLLSRESDDNPSKKRFRTEVITQWYDLWVKVIEEAKELLREKIEIIDATKDREEAYQRIKSRLNGERNGQEL